MTRRRRGVLLGGLAIVLGALAASDVAGREAAIDRRIGPLVDVVVARRPVRAGARLTLADLGLRRVPARFAPQGAFAGPGEVAGLRASASLPAGADVSPAVLTQPSAVGAPVLPGQRVADVVALGSADAIVAGGRVDVVVTRDGGAGGGGSTTLALEDVEVLAVRPAAPASGDGTGAPRVAVSLRVTLRQAVYLAAAQSFAREIRLLPRAAGDRGHPAAGMRVGEGL